MRYRKITYGFGSGVTELIVLAGGDDDETGIHSFQEIVGGGGFTAVMGAFEGGGGEGETGPNQPPLDRFFDIAGE